MHYVFIIFIFPVEALFPRFLASQGSDEEIKGTTSATVLKQLTALVKSYHATQDATENQEFCLIQLDKEKNMAEYSDVEDRVLNYTKPIHKWKPTISKIEKISNPNLEKRFVAAQSKCSGKYIALKFHGTGKEGVEKIPQEGFKILSSARRPPMFGHGIYFATDSSKSAQDIYTKGSNKLLLCEVLLGNAKTVLSADPSLTLEKIRSEGFDSVFAPRNSKSTGGVLYDEFIIYDPDQALPKYIIHYKPGLDSSSSSVALDNDAASEIGLSHLQLKSKPTPPPKPRQLAGLLP